MSTPFPFPCSLLVYLNLTLSVSRLFFLLFLFSSFCYILIVSLFIIFFFRGKSRGKGNRLHHLNHLHLHSSRLFRVFSTCRYLFSFLYLYASLWRASSSFPLLSCFFTLPSIYISFCTRNKLTWNLLFLSLLGIPLSFSNLMSPPTLRILHFSLFIASDKCLRFFSHIFILINYYKRTAYLNQIQ